MISGFNPFTLAPFGDDAEEEDDEGEESQGPVTGEQGVDEKPMYVQKWVKVDLLLEILHSTCFTNPF